MPERILVSYASRLGSTQGVAEAIAKTLSDAQFRVDLRRMTEVTHVAPYYAVVAGSAIRNKTWLPEAMDFMRLFQAELGSRPFAAFLVCMTLTMKADYREAVAGWMQPVRQLVKPVSEGYFAGSLDISRIESFSERLKFQISVAMGVWTEGDHRDWDAIRLWAESLPASFAAARK